MSLLKIYFNNTPLTISDQKNAHSEKPGTRILHFTNNTNELARFINKMWKTDTNEGIITGENFERIKNEVLKNFTLVKAGGGLVINEKNQLLMIFRRGVWDLPKGTLEKGEDIRDCAIREVGEETGIHKLSITEYLGITYHSYKLDENMILKECHWFLMKYNGNEKLTPQLDEDIHQVKWIDRNELHEYLHKTYATIRDIISKTYQH